jgi:hypothetical protein
MFQSFSSPGSGSDYSTFSFYELTILCASINWNHTVLFLWVIYFTWQYSLKVHLCCGICQNFLPSCGWIMFHYLYVHHILFIPSSVNGHGYFRVLLLWIMLFWTKIFIYLLYRLIFYLFSCQVISGYPINPQHVFSHIWNKYEDP